eukprot:2741476-Rhodomonas_salina.1
MGGAVRAPHHARDDQRWTPANEERTGFYHEDGKRRAGTVYHSRKDGPSRFRGLYHVARRFAVRGPG